MLKQLNPSAMKILLPFTIALIFSTGAFSQSRKERQLQTSKRLNTAAWIFAGSGTALVIGGTILLIDADSKQNDYNSGGSDITEVIGGFGLTIMGAAALGTSIPFFIRSHKEHKRAMAFSLKNEHVPLLYKGIFTKQGYPALSLKINLAR
jgi:hypothetical protein